MTQASDAEYLEVITGAIRVCADYRPRFGYGREAGFTFAKFQRLYRADPFYSWFGLDNPLMYAAHRAAGGMTSVYRQIGIGCQWLFNRILRDSLKLDEEAASWSYRCRVPVAVDNVRSPLMPGFQRPRSQQVPAVLYLILWFVSQLFSGLFALAAAGAVGMYGGVAWWAHVGGFVTGLVLARLLARRGYNRCYADEIYPW